MQVRSGPATVVATGIATTFGGHGLEVVLDLRDATLTVELVFASDGGEPAVRTEDLPSGYRLHCANFDDASGRGSALPVLLGAVHDDLVFLHFRVQRFGRTDDRTVTYTFYRVAQAAVGWVPKSEEPTGSPPR